MDPGSAQQHAVLQRARDDNEGGNVEGMVGAAGQVEACEACEAALALLRDAVALVQRRVKGPEP